jgi:hypothetical protein
MVLISNVMSDLYKLREVLSGGACPICILLPKSLAQSTSTLQDTTVYIIVSNF